jgi:hypothetical protein
METINTKKRSKSEQMETGGGNPNPKEDAMAVPVRKRLVRLRLSTGRPVGEKPKATKTISSFAGDAMNVVPAKQVTVNTIMTHTHELSVAYDPTTATFSPLRDDEDYDPVSYKIESFGNIVMEPKSDGRIVCQIAFTLGPNETV